VIGLLLAFSVARPPLGVMVANWPSFPWKPRALSILRCQRRLALKSRVLVCAYKRKSSLPLDIIASCLCSSALSAIPKDGAEWLQ
jgi:hypothetical protein